MEDYIFFIGVNGYGDVGIIDRWSKQMLKEYEEYKINMASNGVYLTEISWAEYLIFQKYLYKDNGVKYAYYLLGYEEPLYPFEEIKTYEEYIEK